MSQSLYENHWDSPTLILINVLGVLGVLNVLVSEKIVRSSDFVIFSHINKGESPGRF